MVVRVRRRSAYVHTASERLKLAAELLPTNLRPSGRNPLATLYSAFSGEIHAGESEESAYDLAIRLQKAFDFLLRRFAEDHADVIEFAKDIGGAASKKT